ncbi:PspC domain-containing protein [Sphingomicrobium sediminis]|uniref:PspC domain-containing protein n=1 Tax=Sphingomicrobium sediminis TaxID=2950949 RepID=A0A9X2J109_9SPHN|nr:PspC domain-containing protein [Sphingomicrobium sediminis]MCM8556239.1 PspC domain-containing protein [Sphingomicrobium sediminis]
MSNKKKIYKYSFAREDRKLAGVCAKLGEQLKVDPTFLRIAFLFTFLFIEWELAVGAYIIGGIYYTLMRRKELEGGASRDRDQYKPVRGSVHDMRTKLDDNDRRMMAIDHHLNSHDSDKLAREIEELRAKVDAKKAAAKEENGSADQKGDA